MFILYGSCSKGWHNKNRMKYFCFSFRCWNVLWWSSVIGEIDWKWTEYDNSVKEDTKKCHLEHDEHILLKVEMTLKKFSHTWIRIFRPYILCTTWSERMKIECHRVFIIFCLPVVFDARKWRWMWKQPPMNSKKRIKKVDSSEIKCSDVTSKVNNCNNKFFDSFFIDRISIIYIQFPLAS